MSSTCPYCQREWPDPQRPRQFCPFCGQAVTVVSTDAYYIRNRVDYRRVATWQRRLLWTVLALILANFSAIPLMAGAWGEVVAMFTSVSWIILHLLVDACIVVMLATLRKHPVVIVLMGVLMLAPCLNLVFLLIANQMATAALRGVGLKVGFMGVKNEDVLRKLNPNLCRQCAYDLTGNVSGRCPECGTDLPRAAAAIPWIIPPARPVQRIHTKE